VKDRFRYSQGRFAAPGDSEFCRLRLKTDDVCKIAGNVTETKKNVSVTKNAVGVTFPKTVLFLLLHNLFGILLVNPLALEMDI